MKENMAKRMAPVHPGMFLKELMTEFGLTQYALAKAIGVQPIRIGQIVAGMKPGRESDAETNLFWHRGLSLSDIALGAAMLAKAQSMGLGQRLRYR